MLSKNDIKSIMAKDANKKVAAVILASILVGVVVITKTWKAPSIVTVVNKEEVTKVSQKPREPPPPVIGQPSPAKESGLARLIKHEVPVKHRLEVHYRDLSACEKPQYLPELEAHCWGECKYGLQCSSPATYKDVLATRARLVCFENFYIIGVRKSGSTDISRYFMELNNICANKECRWGSLGPGDYYPDKYCPMDFFAHHFPQQTRLNTTDRIYHYGPGTLLSSGLYFQNSTHLIVSPATQFLGFMATPDTRFHIQIRHPTERAISYLFHWHKEKEIYPDITHEQFSDEFTDYLLLGLLRQLEECIRDHGELGCIYQTTGEDGVLRNLLKHSLYVIYIEETFKFIPRDQFIITQMEEYSKNETESIKKVMDAFGIEFQANEYLDKQAKGVLNQGRKNPVAKEVIQALDDFFMPYNQRLAKLLSDDKFLYKREETRS